VQEILSILIYLLTYYWDSIDFTNNIKSICSHTMSNQNINKAIKECAQVNQSIQVNMGVKSTFAQFFSSNRMVLYKNHFQYDKVKDNLPLKGIKANLSNSNEFPPLVLNSRILH